MADFDFESGVVCLTGPGAGGLGQYARLAIGHSGLRFSHVTGCHADVLFPVVYTVGFVSCTCRAWHVYQLHSILLVLTDYSSP